MSIEKLWQTSSEKLPWSWQWSPTAENPNAFKVLSQHPVNPELFWKEEAILNDLKKNHVKIEEVELFWRICEIVHIDLPPVNDFQWLKMDVLLIRGWIESLQQSVWLDNIDNNASDKISQFLNCVSDYMKSYWIDLWKNTNFEYVEDSINSQHNDILKYISRFVPWEMYTFLLNWWKVLQVADWEWNYCIKDLDSININADCPLSLLSPDSWIKKSIIYPILWSYYECIELQDWRGKSKADEIMQKMDELKNADLVLVYRNNKKFAEMWRTLKQLIEYKYWWKIYIIQIPMGTEKNDLSNHDMEVLTTALTNCKCMTDGTVSEWTWVDTERIEDGFCENKTEFAGKLNDFLDTARDVEKYCIEKWIDTVYILSSYRSKEKYEWKLLLEHGWYCSGVDGKIYYINKEHDQDEEHYDDAKRFWKNLFPKMNVEFIERDHLEKTWIRYRWKDGRSIHEKYNFNYKKSKWALAIVDRHFGDACARFVKDGWEFMTFAWDSFECEEVKKNVGISLAKKICEKLQNLD